METVVQVAQGQLRGSVENGLHIFKGVPFAAPINGANRFRAPQPRESWSDVRDATQVGLISRQAPLPPPFGSPLPEAGADCLNLNVWSPDVTGSLPVYVWIHGGAFYGGSGVEAVYDGASFARNGVVCVTINYRLGAQGFLHLADHFPEFAESGNAGLLDQIAALKWVQQNIAAFGGDPTRVTIAGESAGGMSVSSLMATSLAKGLFAQAIPQSGAGHNGISAKTATVIAGEVLRRLDVKPGDSAALAKVSDERLFEVQLELMALAFEEDSDVLGEAAVSTMPFQPTYDTAILPKRPIELIEAGSAAGIKVLTGTTMQESLVFMIAMSPMFSEEMLEEMVTATFGSAEKGLAALEKYRANRPGASPLQISAAVETDRMFIVPCRRLADAQLKHSRDVWTYRFDWATPLYDGALGACHALELVFVFNNLGDPAAAYLSGDNAPQDVADGMHQAWVAFVKTGNPQHAGIPEWARHNINDRPMMQFNTTSTLGHNLCADEIALWDGVL
jgi:para-nitrobenzyl esterase